ncbi:hypothetical protein P692DRAFT_20212487, partial [Suillus brevipes Sb2]
MSIDTMSWAFGSRSIGLQWSRKRLRLVSAFDSYEYLTRRCRRGERSSLFILVALVVHRGSDVHNLAADAFSAKTHNTKKRWIRSLTKRRTPNFGLR